MKDGKKFLFYTQEITKQRPKFGCENWFIIIDDSVGLAMVLYNHNNNYHYKTESINDNLNQFVIEYFCVTVNKDIN